MPKRLVSNSAELLPSKSVNPRSHTSPPTIAEPSDSHIQISASMMSKSSSSPTDPPSCLPVETILVESVPSLPLRDIQVLSISLTSETPEVTLSPLELPRFSSSEMEDQRHFSSKGRRYRLVPHRRER